MLAATCTTAHDTLHYAAGLIETGLTPEARAAATATTFRELGDLAGDLQLTPGDLTAGLAILGAPSAVAEAPPIAARRRTCSEIAALLRPVPDGDPLRLAAVFRTVEAKLNGSVGARYRAIAATAGREADELENGARP